MPRIATKPLKPPPDNAGPPGGSASGAGATSLAPVITRVADGAGVGAVFVDGSTLTGSGTEIEWRSNSAMTARVGNQTTTQSELNIPGLVPGTQYWFRVRAIRANTAGNWSDTATRIASL